jgi:uncharacterized membrane protein YoaK (UPF0700 family)
MTVAATLLLSVNGGYVDVAGFLAQQGWFTADVTGNFVTSGASLVFGAGVAAKLLALRVFALVIALARILGETMPARPARRRGVLLTLQLVLLLIGGLLAIRFGPLANADTAPAIVTRKMPVSAMAIENAVHRVHLRHGDWMGGSCDGKRYQAAAAAMRGAASRDV